MTHKRIPLAMAAMQARAAGEKRRRVLTHGQPHDPQVGEPVTRPRKPSEDPKPFCWASCAALRRLEEAFIGGRLTSAKAVYLTFCQIAAERNSEVFQCGHQELAARSGISIRLLRDILPRLEQAGLITWYNVTAAGSLTSMGESLYRLLSSKRANGGEHYVYGPNGREIPAPPTAYGAGGAAYGAGG